MNCRVWTVIIPARPDEPDIKAAMAARQLDYPAEKLEIILARRLFPSGQNDFQFFGRIIHCRAAIAALMSGSSGRAGMMTVTLGNSLLTPTG